MKRRDLKSAESITYVSIAVNLFLSLLKFVVGVFTGSYALIADSFHSISDLATDFIAIFGLKWGEMPVDENHPYGHQRISTLSSMLIACFLIVSCSWLIYDVSCMFFGASGGKHTMNPILALVAASVSFFAKEWLFIKTRKIAKEIHSGVLMSNAIHHRLDSMSSLAVVVGLLVISIFGEKFSFIDPLLSFALALWLGIGGVKIFVPALKDLIDTSPEEKVLKDLKEHVLEAEGVLGYHKFRARRLGDVYDIDLHIQVDPSLSVEKGHEISGKVKRLILEHHPDVISVLIHVEPFVKN